MSLLRDLVITAGDAARLSSDLMRYKLETETKAIKRGVSQTAVYLTFCLLAFLLAAVGFGFILYGAFVLVAYETGPGAGGLIVGFAVLLLAVLVPLVGRGLARRS